VVLRWKIDVVFKSARETKKTVDFFAPNYPLEHEILVLILVDGCFGFLCCSKFWYRMFYCIELYTLTIYIGGVDGACINHLWQALSFSH